MRYSTKKLFEKNFTYKNLSLEDTTFYKGLAILIIVFHNFFHWLPPGIGENEQNFSISRIKNLYNVIINQPEFTLQAVFSLLGHYGVQVFLFLSAYGLTKKYIDSEIVYFKYLRHRIFKIYPAFLFSILIWLLYNGISHGGMPYIIKLLISNWEGLVHKITFISNFIPGELYSINGPWWFVSLIVQFYIIFPFMLYSFRKFGVMFLICFSLCSLLAVHFLQPHIGIPLPGTILMHIPEVSIGIYFAKEGDLRIKYLTIFAIVLIFLLGNFNKGFWYFSFSSILILLLLVFQSVKYKSNKIITNIILFIGSISMYIFYINGFMRQPWINNAKHYDTWYLNIILAIVFFILVVSVSYLMMKISDKINKWKSVF